MHTSIQIQSLQKKIAALQEKQHVLTQERHVQIANLISKCDLSAIDDTLLIGAFCFIRDKVAVNDPLMEVWRKAGSTFLGRPRKKPKNNRVSQKNVSAPQSASIATEQGEA